MAIDPVGSSEQDARKARGAFFTPPAIADFLSNWAVRGNPAARVLDPTCGDGVFLLAASQRLRDLGCDPADLDERVFGIDLHGPSLADANTNLEALGLDAHLQQESFFDISAPDQPDCTLPLMDAVVGNPPFVRYQEHRRESRQRAAAVALERGVRLSGLSSSWAPVLVHASSFLKRDGRLAMVLPAELLTVHYAEPIRRWLRQRFASVTLVLFDRLQFDDALENVVLLLAHGTGGCESFSLAYVEDAGDLGGLQFADGYSVTPAGEGKWTDLLLTMQQRRLFRETVAAHFTMLDEFGSPELGTVTGANDFFTLTEETRLAYGLSEAHVVPICPPGTRHLKGLSFSKAEWRRLKEAGERVWILNPATGDESPELQAYLAHGEELDVPAAYKCTVRTPWWRPSCVSPPDLFFTYMSHRYPRLISNNAGVTFVNSMHGVRLKPGLPRVTASALPLLTLNAVTMLGAELHGRSYGGGILKMEPREAAQLPLPLPRHLEAAWSVLKNDRSKLDRQLRNGLWTNVAKRVDDVLLRDTIRLDRATVEELHAAAAHLRERRMRSQ
jgi:adenine-specific DNA-methyltransferase